MSHAARGDDALAAELLEKLEPPIQYASIRTAQLAGCYFRQNRTTEADKMYARAIQEEEECDQRKSAENKAYIVAYCQFYRNKIAELGGADAATLVKSEVHSK